MANQDNKLAHLKIGTKEFPDIDALFNIQSSLQSFIADAKGVDDITRGNYTMAIVSSFMLQQKHAFDDEFHEMMDAIGGIDDGVGSAAWKWWKDDHKKAHITYLNEMSDNDMLELKFEAVDMLHFFINMCIILGMTGSEMMNMYIAKNAENIERQKRGY